MDIENGFKCRKCGLCCRNLDKSSLYEELHNGDGVCKYLNLHTNLCTIYDNRPTLCNIELSYNLYFSDKLSLEDYYNLNYEGCENIWRENQKNKKIE